MEESKRQATLEKLQKHLAESFVDDVRVADEKAMRDKIVQLSKELEDHDEIKKNDSTLNALKEQVSDLNGGYKDARKEKSNRLKYVILTLEERGKL